MIRTIFFDLGDTLIHFGLADPVREFIDGARRTHEYLSRLPECTERMPSLQRYIKVHLKSMRWAYFWSRMSSCELDVVSLLHRLADKLGYLIPDEHLIEVLWLWYEPVAEKGHAEENLSQTLANLRDQGYQMAIVSNTFVPGCSLDRHLGQESLLEFFPVRIYSCDVGFCKPHHRIFDVAIERTGATAADSVFIGDTWRADIVGARRAGMTPIWRTEEPGKKDVLSISRIADLSALLDTLNAQQRV